MLYTHSKGSGATTDAIGPVLQILTAGCILSVAREARAREYDASPGPVPAGLRDPLLVVGLPKGWEKTKYEVGAKNVPRFARVWAFARTANGAGPSGIRVNRSERLSIREALDFIKAGVY